MLEVQGNIVSENYISFEHNQDCSIFTPSVVEVTMVDYQAYNWFSQICLANYNYLYYPNYSLCLDSNLSPFLES